MKKFNIEIGNTFATTYSGSCEVVDITRDSHGYNPVVTVKFPLTENLVRCRPSALRAGLVNDPQHPEYKSQKVRRKYAVIKVGDVFTTNKGGDCKVIKVDGTGAARSQITVEFINTGYVTLTTPEQLRKGSVRDRYAPVVYDRGFLGEGVHKASDPAYDLWYAIMQRCYRSEPYRSTTPSYSDAEVCKEWYNYQQFADFYIQHYKEGCQLDKDIRQPGCKLYSPDTCMFVPRTVNNADAILRTLVAENPEYLTVLQEFRKQAIHHM